MTKVKRVVTLLFGKGFNILINFLFLPYMARVLSYEDYGSYGQILLICAFAGAILSLGLPQILFIYLAKEEESQKIFDSNFIAIFFVGLFGGLLLYLLSDEISSWMGNQKLGELLRIFSWSMPLQLGFQSIISRLITEQKVKTFTLINISSNLIKVALVVLSIQLYRSVSLVFYSILIAMFFQFFVGLVYAKWGEKGFKFSQESIKNQLRDGMPLGVTNLLGTGIFYLDGLMVSRYLGVESYAIYRNGAFEVPFISTISNSINAVILPEISKLYNKGSYSQIIKLKKQVVVNTMAFVYPVLIFLMYNSQEFIVTYLGEAYRESAVIFAIFNLTLLVRVNDYQDILMAARRTKLILFFNLLIFGLNILLNVILIQKFGIVGAAVATVACIFTMALILFRRNLKEINAKFSEVVKLKRVLSILLISFGLLFMISLPLKFVQNSILSLTISAAIFFPLIYLIFYWNGFISKQLIFDLLKRNKAAK